MFDFDMVGHPVMAFFYFSIMLISARHPPYRTPDATGAYKPIYVPGVRSWLKEPSE
jgi:hypothetical protein